MGRFRVRCPAKESWVANQITLMSPDPDAAIAEHLRANPSARLLRVCGRPMSVPDVVVSDTSPSHREYVRALEAHFLSGKPMPVKPPDLSFLEASELYDLAVYRARIEAQGA